jgi:hypothetical protein
MNQRLPLISLALVLCFGGAASAEKQAATKKSSGKATVTCPIMKVKVTKAKATAVKTKSGKTVWVCCDACIGQAKKLK